MIDRWVLDKRGPLYPENAEKVKAASNSAVDPLFLQTLQSSHQRFVTSCFQSWKSRASDHQFSFDPRHELFRRSVLIFKSLDFLLLLINFIIFARQCDLYESMWSVCSMLWTFFRFALYTCMWSIFMGYILGAWKECFPELICAEFYVSQALFVLFKSSIFLLTFVFYLLGL